MKFLLVSVLAIALCFCSSSEDLFDPMDLDTLAEIESDSDLLRVMIWSIQQDKAPLRDEMAAALHKRLDRLVGLLDAENYLPICGALGLMNDEAFWFQHLQHHLLAEAKSAEYFQFFHLLMKFPYSSSVMLGIEEICVAKLKATLDEQFLRAMMDIEALPVLKDSKAMSTEWYALLELLIAQGNFKLFRMIIADWMNFKVRTNLGQMRAAGSKLCIYKEISLLAEAIAMGRTDMAWLLAGRTWYFHLFSYPVIRATSQYVKLTSMIPELTMVPWDSQGLAVKQEVGKFIQKIAINYPNHVDAQCLVLTSSLCPHDINAYITDAISNHHVYQVVAAAKCDKLLPEHLSLVHVAGDDFKCCYGSLNLCLGKADITSLQYRNSGRLVSVIAQREYYFNRRALALMNWYITQMGTKMQYMEILEAIDRVYTLDKLEQDVFVQLKGISADFANAFLADPAIITDYQAFELAKFYHAHQYTDFAFELLMRSSNERIATLLEASTGVCNLSFTLPLCQVALKRTQKPDLISAVYKYLEHLAQNKANRQLINDLLQKTNMSIVVNLFKEAVIHDNFKVIKTLTYEKVLSEDGYGEVVQLIFDLGNVELFSFFWPFASHNRASICGSILPSAILSGKIDFVEMIVLGSVGLLQVSLEQILPILAEKKDFEMIQLLLKSRSKVFFKWAASNNILFKTAVQNGKKELAQSLLLFPEVLKLAVESGSTEALLMFPELRNMSTMPL